VAAKSAATEQQQHDNNNQDQFHRNSPLTPTNFHRAKVFNGAFSSLFPINRKPRPTCIPGCEQFARAFWFLQMLFELVARSQ
jgi:hypothetical protein